MKLGLVQCDIHWETPEANRIQAEGFFNSAWERGIELLIFPEMTFTGFSMRSSLAPDICKENLRHMRELSVRYGIATVYGDAWSETGKASNRSIALDGKGQILWQYTKIHPFSYAGEEQNFVRGQHIVCADLGGIIASSFVCYDLRFPEIFQIASLKAELLIVIANWPQSRITHWDALLKARAIENQAYVIGVNRVGEGDGILYNGHSGVYDPSGVPLTEATEDEGILTCTIDVERARLVRDRFPLKADRDNRLYARLLLGDEME